jgi:hypothetical protein
VRRRCRAIPIIAQNRARKALERGHPLFDHVAEIDQATRGDQLVATLAAALRFLTRSQLATL